MALVKMKLRYPSRVTRKENNVEAALLTRRDFLRASARVAALWLVPLVSSCASKGPARRAAWRPRLALSSVMFSDLPLPDFCEQAAALGFNGIDLWGPFGKCRHLVEAQQLGVEGFRRLLARHKLQIGCYTTYRTTGHTEGFPAYGEFIGQCGGGVVVRESEYSKFPPEGRAEGMRKFFAKLQPEIDLARRHRVRLAIENHQDALLSTLDSMRLFRTLNPAPDAVGIALAGYHLQGAGISVEEAVRVCGDQLLFFYAWQKGNGFDQLPGHSPTDFTPWLQALAAIGYHGWITPFMHGEEPAEKMAQAVAKARAYLDHL
jgi:sugar phosphate isomerase/epimerase